MRDGGDDQRYARRRYGWGRGVGWPVITGVGAGIYVLALIPVAYLMLGKLVGLR